MRRRVLGFLIALIGFLLAFLPADPPRGPWAPAASPGKPIWHRASAPNPLIVEELLTIPGKTHMMVSVVPREAGDWRVQYGTSSGEPYAVTSGIETATAATMVEFFLGVDTSALTANTKYFYRTQHRPDAGSPWTSRPEYHFWTLPEAGTPFAFVATSDSHLTQQLMRSNCADPNDVGFFRVKRFTQAAANLVARVDDGAADRPRFFLTNGDESMTHVGNAPADCDIDGLQTGTGTITSQPQAEARWRYWTQRHSLFGRYIPIVISGGNHDGELASTHYVAADGHSPQIAQWSENARLKYLPNANQTGGYPHGRTDPENGNYYRFLAGNGEFIIADVNKHTHNRHVLLSGNPSTEANVSRMQGIQSTSGSAWTGVVTGYFDSPNRLIFRQLTGASGAVANGQTIQSTSGSAWTATIGTVQVDHPPNHPDGWTLGVEQKAWLEGLLTASTATYRFIATHNLVGGGGRFDDGTASGSYSYGRGNIRTTTDQVLEDTCVGFSGTSCIDDLDCRVHGTTCMKGSPHANQRRGGTMTNPFAGEQAGYQTLAAAKPPTFWLYGHDHVAAWAEKPSASAAGTRVYYMASGTFGGLGTSSVWYPQDWFESHYDFDLNTFADYCRADFDCPTIGGGDSAFTGLDTDGKGSTRVGYTLVKVTPTQTSFDYRIVVIPEDDERNEWPSTIPTNDQSHFSLVVPAETGEDFTQSATCELLVLRNTNYLTDQCTLEGDANPSDAFVVQATKTAPVESTSVPGVYGPSGADPRRSRDFALSTDILELAAPASDQFNNTQDWTLCAWVNTRNDGTARNVTQMGVHQNKLNIGVNNQTIARSFATDAEGITNGVLSGTWRHICGRSDTNGSVATVRVFRDGSDSTTIQPTPTAPVQASNPWCIGARCNGNNPFGGFLHELIYFQDAISNERICQLARCGARDDVRDRGFACTMPAGEACRYQ